MHCLCNFFSCYIVLLTVTNICRDPLHSCLWIQKQYIWLKTIILQRVFQWITVMHLTISRSQLLLWLSQIKFFRRKNTPDICDHQITTDEANMKSYFTSMRSLTIILTCLFCWMSGNCPHFIHVFISWSYEASSAICLALQKNE
jgi:hypothetical protein